MPCRIYNKYLFPKFPPNMGYKGKHENIVLKNLIFMKRDS